MLKLHCDNPGCDNDPVDWPHLDRLPVDWWEVSKVVPDGVAAPEYAVCSAACVRGLHELLLMEDDAPAETSEPVGDL